MSIVVHIGSWSTGVDANGAVWTVTGETGWSSTPTVRLADTPRSFAHGDWDATSWFDGRQIELTGIVSAPSANALVASLDDLRGILADTTELVPLVVDEPTGSRQTMVRAAADLKISRVTPTLAEFDISLLAPDPRIYDANQSQLTTTLPTSSGGGVAPPLTPPILLARSTVGGILNINNVGNITTLPTFRIVGPVTNPTVSNDTTGDSCRFAISLNSGDTLTVDSLARTVMLNETASRRNTMTGTWIMLPPGQSSIRFGGSGSGTLTVIFRSAWI